jgi:tRNA A-37 threonylcarbamoyl transferase component Bud32
MHEYGVYHADLNARNILVGRDGVYVIDFDNARVSTAPARRSASAAVPVAGARNLLRLRRSIDKLGLPERTFDLICEGYGVTTLPIWLARLYRWKGALSDLVSGRVRSHAP